MNISEKTTGLLLRRLSVSAAVLVLSLAAKAADYPTTILNDGPTAYYRFEETSGGTAYDSTANHLDAGINENGEGTSPVLGEPGIDTNSYLFIGAGPGGAGDYGYVNVPASPLITPLAANGTNSAAFSAELWVQPTTYPQSSYIVPIEQGAYNNGTPEGWNVYVSGPDAGNGPNQSYFYIYLRPSLFQGFGDVQIQFGQWYHLVLTYDGTNAMFYINGLPHGPYALPGFIPWTGDGAHIGSGQDVGWNPFIGSIDEVAFYTNALTFTQITNHYEIGTNSFRAAYTAASISSDVTPQTNFSGFGVTFSVSAGGTLPLTYQWYSNSVPVGTDANTLSMTAQYPFDTNAMIDVVVSNAYGPPVTSSVVTLTVLTNVNVLYQSSSATRNIGGYAAFHVTAQGPLPFTYQWSVSADGGNTFNPILTPTNATALNPTLWLTNLQMPGNGIQYACTVTGPFGGTMTSAATLTVQSNQDPPVALNGYGAIVAADKPVAYWRFDETGGNTAYDAIDSFDGLYTPNTGSITFGALTGIPHCGDAAVTLAGTPGTGQGATVQIPYEQELNSDTAWSVETWVQPSSLGINGNDYRVIVASEYNEYPYPYNGWYLYQEPSGELAFAPQPGNIWVTGGQMVASNWYYIAITDDTTNFNLYINGVLSSSYAVANDQFVPNGDGITPIGTAGVSGDDGSSFVIGQRTDAAFDNFLGTVDDTAVYNYALAPLQVALHYADATILNLAKLNGTNVLTWKVGVLQASTNLTGLYTNVPAASSPYTNTMSGFATFFRVYVP